MSIPDLVADFQARAKAAGLPMKAVCEKAGVAQSTFSRWKSGVMGPSYLTVQRLEEALAELESAQPERAT